MSSKFTFYYGCMGSGKSLDLIRTAYNYKEKGLKFEAFKPKTDTREGSDECVISTRVGLTIPAHWLEEDKNSLTNQLLQHKDADVIFIGVGISYVSSEKKAAQNETESVPYYSAYPESKGVLFDFLGDKTLFYIV